MDEALEDEFCDVGDFLLVQHLVPCRHFSAVLALGDGTEQRRSIKLVAGRRVQEIARFRVDEISARAAAIAVGTMASGAVLHIEGGALDRVACHSLGHGCRHIPDRDAGQDAS